MSKYTVSIYELEKNNFDFGLNDYPIFDESARPLLNERILNFYKFREIGFQNPWVFRDRLRARMDLIMSQKYNELFKVKQKEFNPLYNIEIHETFEHEIKAENNGTDKTTDDSLAYTTTLPNQKMTEQNITDNIYADSANKGKQNTTTQSNGSNTQKETYTRTQEGSSAGLPFSKAMEQFFHYLDKCNVVDSIIRDLGDLFLTIY